MRREFELIYIGMLKYGFISNSHANIAGLINYVLRNAFDLEEQPIIEVNRNYVVGGDEWFWELEWKSCGKCLVIYFDRAGCHYQRIYDAESISGRDQGIIHKQEEFLEHFRWLSE
jgi:hypothetical protein